jgi:hypothetical protein
MRTEVALLGFPNAAQLGKCTFKIDAPASRFAIFDLKFANALLIPKPLEPKAHRGQQNQLVKQLFLTGCGKLETTGQRRRTAFDE